MLFTTSFGINLASAESAVIQPIAWYEFDDASNLGKDSMGNYDLKLVKTVTQASEGGALFTGAGMLRAPSEAADISEKLTSFTLAFEMSIHEGNSDWAMPIGFSRNDWTPTKFAWFTIEGGNKLRFTAHDVADGSTDGYWGPVIDAFDYGQNHKIVLSAQLGGKITIYVDGVKSSYEHDLPVDFNLKDSNMQFAIGAASVWSNDETYNPFNGIVKDVKIYPFAMTQAEVEAYNANGQLTADDIDVTVASADIDMSETIQVEEGASEEDILKAVPTSSLIDVTMSDDSVRKGTVVWNNVIIIDGDTYLEGDIKDIVNINSIKARAKITVVKGAVELKAVAKYEFNDTSNIGKDSEGNYDLTTYGDVTKTSEGVMINNGLLFAGADIYGKDFSDYLNSATISLRFKVNTLSTNPWWCIFSIDDYWAHSNTAGLSLFIQDINLRLCATGNDWWEDVIVQITPEQEYQVDMVIDKAANKLYAYVNNDLKCTVNLAEDYKLSVDGSVSTFALGGANQDGGRQTDDVGVITFTKAVVYNFAMNANQISVLYNTDSIKTNNLGGAKYLEEIDTDTLAFENDVVSNQDLLDKMPAQDILSLINKATVQGKLSDSTTTSLPVIWTDVDMDTYELKGYVSTIGLGMPTIAEQVQVTKQFTVIPSYSVTVETAQNGSIEVSSNYGVAEDVIIITPQPAAHYRVNKVFVNDQEIQAVKGVYSVTITNEDLVISATFEPIVYQVTVGEISNGTIALSAQSGVAGTQIEITATPNAHYVLTKVYVNGVQITPTNSKYVFTIDGDAVVTAEFEEAIYNIDLIVGNNGQASLDKTSGEAGETVTITITPNEEYRVSSVTVNNQPLEAANGVYQFVIDGDAEVKVNFEKITYSIAVDSNITNGTVTVDNAQAAKGAKVTITVTPKKGYKVSKVLVNGEEIQAEDGVYSFEVEGETTVSAEFVKKSGCANAVSELFALAALAVGLGYFKKKFSFVMSLS